jgi:hypothetical protein
MEKDISEILRKVILAAGQIVPGSKTHILVRHENECPALKTQRISDCVCSPEIKKIEAH